MAGDELGFLEAQLPRLLKLAGFNDAQRAVAVEGVLWVVAKVGEIDLRARRQEALVRALVKLQGIDPDQALKEAGL